eukprot:364173-Chlamydomonas_euryale.AAC.10
MRTCSIQSHYYRRGRNFSAPGSAPIPPRTCRKPVAARASRGRLPKPSGVWDVRLKVWVQLCCTAHGIRTPLSYARSLAVEQHRFKSALPDASKKVLKHLSGPPLSKGGGAQPVAKHDHARIATFSTRTPVPGKPPGTRQRQEDPPKAAAAAEPETEVTRDAGSAPEPEPPAKCGEEAQILDVVIIGEEAEEEPAEAEVAPVIAQIMANVVAAHAAQPKPPI